MLQYIDPHNEGTFVYNGNRYYLSQLYTKKIGIIKPIVFYPVGKYSNGKPITFTSGFTQPVYSSGHINNKLILLFDVPGIPSENLQYYCYLDNDAMIFPSGMESKGKVDEKEYRLNQQIQEQVAYSKLDTFGKIWYQIKPIAIPALILFGIYMASKFKK
jgi:hypothetical protein